jgi:hypothetical protein
MKLRILHYFLKDKDDYQHDPYLNQRWEVYTYLLNHLGKESPSIIKDKFMYFIKYKKLSTVKRLTVLLSLFLTLYFGGYYVGKSLFGYFGWNLEKTIYDTSKIQEYVPDTIPVDRRIKDLSVTLSLNENQIKKRFSFVVVYSIDSSKNLKKFLEVLGRIESGGDYKSRRPNSQYLGKYQMGDAARKAIGFDKQSYETFLNTPLIQDAAVVLLLRHNYDYMKPYLKKYDNRIIRGYHLTESGMLAMAHNVGADAVIGWLRNNCPNNNVPKDGNGSADRFLILGNYNLTGLYDAK